MHAIQKKITKLPIVGDVPVVLALILVIGFVGILSSFMTAFQSRNEIIAMLESVNPPPPKVSKIDARKCRGICSDEGSFQTLENFMNSLKTSEYISDPTIVLSEPIIKYF